MSSSLQDGAVELAGATLTPGGAITATDTAAAKGNFYPKVAARAGSGQWLMSTATDFAATTVQRLGTGGSGGGTPPPPPPPAPCTPTPAVTSLSVLSGQTTFPINVSAPSGCAWSATSNASWLQISSNASATGSAAVGVTALHNTSSASRTGTITIGSQTVTVQQVGFYAAAVMDLDGDGLSDLVWQNRSTGALGMWTIRGNSVTSTQWLNAPALADPAWRIGGTGDINGDGFADLVWQNSNDGTLSAWLMRGTQILGASVLQYSPVNPSWKIRGVADVNGDGKADLIWQHDAGWVGVWLMNGYNVISTTYLSVSRTTDPNWVIVGAGDVTGDNRADIFWQNQATGQVGVWFMNGASVIATRYLSTYSSDLNWKIHGIGDVTGDGMADVLWQNEATGALGVWYMNGSTVFAQYLLSIQTLTDLSWNMVGPG
jgi:VCBS repeat protein/BACON domain-containing protein